MIVAGLHGCFPDLPESCRQTPPVHNAMLSKLQAGRKNRRPRVRGSYIGPSIAVSGDDEPPPAGARGEARDVVSGARGEPETDASMGESRRILTRDSWGRG